MNQSGFVTSFTQREMLSLLTFFHALTFFKIDLLFVCRRPYSNIPSQTPNNFDLYISTGC